MVADLYSEVLVAGITEPGAAVAEPSSPSPVNAPLNILGKNEKKVLVVVDNEAMAFLQDNELTFLTNILTACKLSLADVAIINWHHVQADYQQVLTQLESKTVLLFDVAPLRFGLPFNFPPYQVQQFDKKTFLFAPSLHIVEENLGEKKNLWNALRTIFNI